MQSNSKPKASEAVIEPRGQIVHQVQLSDAQPADADVLTIIENRNALLSKILQYAISATHPGQWVDQSGHPYPTAAAAEVMARRCAVKITNVQTNKVPSSDDKGGFYMYVVTATASLPGGYDSIEALGTCSSRDTFLGTETRAGRPLSEIDEGNILKAAYSNMLVNAITRLLGVRNLTWEKLASLGIDQGAVAKVEYQTGSKGGGQTASKEGVAVIPFGRTKGAPITDITDKDLAWHIDAAEKKVAENDPKWGDKNKRWLDTLKAELGRRANAKTSSAPATPEASPWDRIQALLRAAGILDLAKFTKGATGKTSSGALTEDDVGKVEAAIKAVKNQDVPF